MPHITYLNHTIDQTIKTLSKLRTSGVKSEFSFELNCADLKDYITAPILEAPEFQNTFKQLKLITGPVLYWIEIVSDIESEIIIDALQNYRSGSNIRTTPATKKNIDYSSQILYVGKVKSTFWGRAIQHMGYFKNAKTQGLQLYHWAASLPLTLKFHVLEFEPEMANLMSAVEYAFAQNLKPLIGKHK